MDSHLSYWCYRCNKFVRNNLGFCPECESAFVEDIEAPSPSTRTDTNYMYRKRKPENLLHRLNLAIIVRGGYGGREIERYFDSGSGFRPCSPGMHDCFKESEDDRLITKLALTQSNCGRNSRHCVLPWLSARNPCHVCRHEYPMDGGLTAPGAPRVILCEVEINDSSVRKIFQNMFSFFRRNSSSSSSSRRAARYWELVDSGGLHWHRLR
ncbi:hypothetical protein MKW98_020990 [Papaver atlanticum]|uniref:RING-type E3 ubiquitin transferase n=1 Tax=Papaver atlanticum TaxID=357466 RepID=A0AAD4SL44_9MAGN|nr:hypothetical protein MKW98_020990 [Papaver atlanticum]